MTNRCRRLLFLLILVLAAGCTPTQASPPPAPQVVHIKEAPATSPAMQEGVLTTPAATEVKVLRSYPVKRPLSDLQRLADELNRLLNQRSREGDSNASPLTLGRARAFPGQLVVLAPERLQASVEGLIKALPADLDVNASVDVESHYWIVMASPAPTSGAGSIPALGSALSAIEATYGDQRFELVEHISLRSTEHEEAQIDGRYGFVRQRLGRNAANALQGELDIGVYATVQLKTSVVLKADQLLVLGQVGYRPPKHSAQGERELPPTRLALGENDEANLFFIARYAHHD